MLRGKTALITGASRGIGLAIADTFARHGCRVVLCARDASSLECTAAQITQDYGVEAIALPLDVADAQAVKGAYQSLFKTVKTLDILVNNAGILDDALLGMVSQAQIERTFGINTFAPLYMAQYGARLMHKNGGGSIINISSIIATHGNAGQAVYGGSKAALLGITLSLAKELAAQHIRVNAIAPGFIDTDMTRSLSAQKFEERLRSIAMGRIGTPQDIANTALYLASDLSAYVTGQVIGVDGGMLI